MKKLTSRISIYLLLSMMASINIGRSSTATALIQEQKYGVIFTFDDTSIDEWYDYKNELIDSGITATRRRGQQEGKRRGQDA